MPFSVGQVVVCVEAEVSGQPQNSAQHPALKTGREYVIKTVMSDGRVVVEGLSWGFSPERFKERP